MKKSKNEMAKPSALSAREIEILQWTACGKTSDEIALLLKLSVPTVNTYIRRACSKLDAVNKTHALTITVAHAVISALSSSLTTILPFLFGVSGASLNQRRDSVAFMLRRTLAKKSKQTVQGDNP